jgi:peptide/nickel transport system permease protein
MNPYIEKFKKKSLGMGALAVIFLFFLAGTYAPFLASNKPLVVLYENSLYFPLFKYLFFQGFYSKSIDLFFNILMFTLPLFLFLPFWIPSLLQVALFTFLALVPIKDPATSSYTMNENPDWNLELQKMSSYQKLNLILEYQRNLDQKNRVHSVAYQKEIPILWNLNLDEEKRQRELYESDQTPYSKAKLDYLKNKRAWLQSEAQKISFRLMPLLRDFHWEEAAGGDQNWNVAAPFMELTRTNRKDLVSALLFGIRISLVVGILAVALALVIGIPIGALGGYFGGRTDIIICRILEVWESMPTFFMLLLIVAITQSKSIFLVIGVVAFFGWTGIARYVRGEFFKQKELPYVEALKALGFGRSAIIFKQILPNALPLVLTLLPFAIMGAISSEAGLSFLGLGEEGSCSWGVLMDEGRVVFPGESYLLWPPALMLTTLLVAIALAGDALRDALDPRV